jgi:hypothetical protein
MGKSILSSVRVWTVATMGFSSIAGLVVACGGADSSIPELPPTTQNPAPPNAAAPAPVQKTVGSQGGEVTSSEGSGVEVPEGAVPNDVDISVAPAPNAPPPPASQAEAVVGTPYVLGPSGLQFAKPVTIVLAFDPAKLPPGKTAQDILVFTAKDGTTDYKPLPTRVRDANKVEAETTHFSVFIPTIPADDYDPGFTDAGPPAVDACAPVLCGSYGPGACGSLGDGCGGLLDCGTCPTATDAGPSGSDASTGGGTDASTGGGDASPNVDAGTGGDGGVCMALTCQNYKECGLFNDGCGGLVKCEANCITPDGGGGGGGSDASTGMDAGPAPDSGGCQLMSCADYKFSCGTFDDGCGKPLDCTMYCADGGGGGGGSDAGASMDSGPATDGGCQILSCADYKFTCGTFDDGCGKPLDCTMYCSDGGGGGGGGTDAGVTMDGGVSSEGGAGCQALSCADFKFTCGTFDDGCGQSLDCTVYCDGGMSEAGP